MIMNDARKLIRIFWILLLMTTIFSVCMQLISRGFHYESTGNHFTIFDLELPATQVVLKERIEDMSDQTKKNVQYQLLADFPFMASVYPGIAVLFLYCRAKVKSKKWKAVFLIAALLQIAPWAFDILENLRISCWLNDPDDPANFELFRFIVIAKVAVAAGGFFLLALPASLILRFKSTSAN
jgi:hypothetical protein